MTTPTIDFALPVSFTLVRQAGSDQLMRADGGDHYRLEGPSMVAASWSGPQKAEIWHQHKTADGWRWRKLAEFNGGGGGLSELGQNPANTWLFTFVLQLLRRMWRKTTEGRSRSIRSSRRGGGVNGRRFCPAGNHIIRRNISRGRDRTLQRRAVSATVRGSLDSLCLKQNRGHDGVLVPRDIGSGSLLVDFGRARGDQSDYGRRGPERCGPVPQYPHERRRSRYRPDDYHLPALNTTGGDVK